MMLQDRIFLLCAGLSLGLGLPSTAHADPCEQEVVAVCVSTTCPTFCRGEDDPQACAKTCTAEDRCKIHLFGSGDREDQKALDAQVREQLMACLAENREEIQIEESLDAPMLEEDAPKPEDPAPHGSVADTTAASHGWMEVESPSFHDRVEHTPEPEPEVEAEPDPPPDKKALKAMKKAEKKAKKAEKKAAKKAAKAKKKAAKAAKKKSKG